MKSMCKASKRDSRRPDFRPLSDGLKQRFLRYGFAAGLNWYVVYGLVETAVYGQFSRSQFSNGQLSKWTIH
ncbi:hypothetical protein L596_021926 [Steinernema carpocapsae]|uniref:Uncharacterized protein n=1 Tax=Steinernema carpocapsae TaxID=34508 RepID=A0A4U5MKA3_STECR|nr:hypothetical protein L596_021926 [Steinernema carpocapsae]